MRCAPCYVCTSHNVANIIEPPCFSTVTAQSSKILQASLLPEEGPSRRQTLPTERLGLLFPLTIQKKFGLGLRSRRAERIEEVHAGKVLFVVRNDNAVVRLPDRRNDHVESTPRSPCVRALGHEMCPDECRLLVES